MVILLQSNFNSLPSSAILLAHVRSLVQSRGHFFGCAGEPASQQHRGEFVERTELDSNGARLWRCLREKRCRDKDALGSNVRRELCEEETSWFGAGGERVETGRDLGHEFGDHVGRSCETDQQGRWKRNVLLRIGKPGVDVMRLCWGNFAGEVEGELGWCIAPV